MPIVNAAVSLVLVGLTFYGLGGLVFRLLRFPDNTPRSIVMDFAMGAMTAAFIATGTAALGLLTPNVARFLGVVFLFLGLLDLRSMLAGIFKTPANVFSSLTKFDRFALLAFAVLAIPAFATASVPPFSWDALNYHLAFPRHVLTAGDLSPMPNNFYSHFPMGAEMIFTLLLPTLGDRACGIFHAMTWGLAGWGIYVLMRERAGRPVSFLVALAVLTNPAAWVEAGTAYIDMTLAFYLVAAVTAVSRFAESRDFRWAALAGLLAGFTVSLKYTGMAYCLALSIPMLLLAFEKNSATARKGFPIFAVCGILAGSVFLVRNLFQTGNPFYPFGYSLFGGTGWTAAKEKIYGAFLFGWGMGRTLPDYLMLPVRMAFFGKFQNIAFDGTVGPMALLLPVAAVIGAFDKSKRLMRGFGLASLAAAVFLITGTHQARFAAPVLVLLAPQATIGISRLLEGRRALKTAVMSAAVLLLAGNLFQASKVFAAVDPFRASVGLETEESFLGRNIPGYRLYRLVNELPSGSRVLAAWTGNLEYLFHIPYASDAFFEDETLKEILQGAGATANPVEALAQANFTHFFFDSRKLKHGLPRQEWERLSASLLARARLIGQDGPLLLFELHKGEADS